MLRNGVKPSTIAANNNNSKEEEKLERAKKSTKEYTNMVNYL